MIMQKKYMFVLAALSLLISGCGSSSTAGEDGDKNTTGGGGTCVNLPLPDKVIIEYDFNISKLEMRINQIDHNDTYYKEEINSSATANNLTVETNSTIEHYFAISPDGHYRDFSKNVTTAVSTTGDFNSTTIYDPYFRSLFDRHCQGDKFTQEYDQNTTTTGVGASTSNKHNKFETVVEKVHVTKKIKAGEFDTVQIKHISKIGTPSDANTTMWVDIDTGVVIYSEINSSTVNRATEITSLKKVK
jgi:hypothetical protein